MFGTIKCRIKLKLGQVWSKSRSFDEILDKAFLHSKGLKVLFTSNVYLYESRGSLRLDQVGLSTRSLGLILGKSCVHSKGTILIQSS